MTNVFGKEANNDYNAMVKAAQLLEIATRNVKKDELSKQLNEKIAEIGEDKYNELVAAAAAPEENQATNQASEQAPAATQTADETALAAATPAAPAAKKGKWYDEANAFPYKANEVVEVTSHAIKGLIGRLASVVKPADKKDAIKGHLMNEKTGEFQQTLATFNFTDITSTGKTSDVVKDEIKAAQEAKIAAKQVKATEAAAATDANEVQAQPAIENTEQQAEATA